MDRPWVGGYYCLESDLVLKYVYPRFMHISTSLYLHISRWPRMRVLVPAGGSPGDGGPGTLPALGPMGCQILNSPQREC